MKLFKKYLSKKKIKLIKNYWNNYKIELCKIEIL